MIGLELFLGAAIVESRRLDEERGYGNLPRMGDRMGRFGREDGEEDEDGGGGGRRSHWVQPQVEEEAMFSTSPFTLRVPS